MRYTWLIILSIIFLLLVYTAKFWMEWIDFVGLLMTSVVLVSGLLFLGTCLIWHLVFGIKEKFKDRERIVVIAVLFVVVPVAYFQPFGLITPDRFDGKDILVAQREGVANCMTVFRLKENNRFWEETSCFGIERIKGEYEIKNDTVYFRNIESGDNSKPYYEFAVIRKTRNTKTEIGALTRFKTSSDSTATELWIIKNDLP